MNGCCSMLQQPFLCHRKFLRFKREKLFFYSIGLECQKVHFISYEGKLHKMFPCVRLRHMDFLKYSGKFKETDVTALHSPSGRTSGFSGRPCPEITGDFTEY